MDEKNVKKQINEDVSSENQEDKSKYEAFVGENISFDPNEEIEEDTDAIDSDLVHFDVDVFDENSEEDEETPKKRKPKVYHKIKHEAGGGIRTMSAVLVYVLAVVICGVILGSVMVQAINDVFAFVKEGYEVEITIDTDDMSASQLAKELKRLGVIDSEWAFKLYVAFKYDEGMGIEKGTYIISPAFNYDKIISSLHFVKERETVTITIPEGFTTDQIIDLFVSYGIGTREGFEEALEFGEFDYWFLEDLSPDAKRRYRLDGYLFPDTYYFFTDSSEKAAIKKLLANFEKKIDKKYRERCEELGMSFDEVVTLASMIQMEAYLVDDYQYISSVFHNRLKNSATYPHLQSDATIAYYVHFTTGERPTVITDEHMQMQSPYNTYTNEGLPPGAICSPSLNAIKAAMYPMDPLVDENDTSQNPKRRVCYYFVTYEKGKALYAQTYSEHQKNIERIKEEEAED